MEFVQPVQFTQSKQLVQLVQFRLPSPVVFVQLRFAPPIPAGTELSLLVIAALPKIQLDQEREVVVAVAAGSSFARGEYGGGGSSIDMASNGILELSFKAWWIPF